MLALKEAETSNPDKLLTVLNRVSHSLPNPAFL